ncbi:gliding motility-associated ABC transporter permease subunit GldF [Muriicola marianensis]|uniref:Gliding motility-associated ABC transporter permease subunit GldF n=1 Tax=Muriicola marianensis TaxID=1324801 RepID=A0ABQ1QS51_9FLAO|nr:gliding motility-associated ABC transporter permease subunit GldF [Muriicola marianensis]GGD40762.1 gliding motility-associated ABC transporter permease subunit GldF [Muriicola marianensis]
MLSILKREITSFFASATGPLALVLFLLINGLVLWVFQGSFNVFDYGFSDLSAFFMVAPFVFLILIPALTMKSFSEERKLGTLELLLMKPLPAWKLVLGKLLGVITLGIIALIPTLVYVWCISALGTEAGNFDLGLVFGAYSGMILLLLAYTSIGVFSSSLTENQIVAFLFAVIICLFMYLGFEAISGLFSDGIIALFLENLGAMAHYERMGRGILDTRDVVYLLSISFFFGFLTVIQLNRRA